MAVFQEVLPGTNRASSFAPRDFLTVRKIVAHRSRIAVLLEVSEILHHQPLLLACDASAAILLHQIKNSLAILTFACMVVLLVVSERILADEIFIAKLAHQWTANDGIVRKPAQLVAVYFISWHISLQFRWRL